MYNMHAQHLGRYIEGQKSHHDCSKIRSAPIAWLFEVWFYNYFTKMITILSRWVVNKFESIPWRSISQHDLAEKSCPVHNFAIWICILHLFPSNDHHIETTCLGQHFWSLPWWSGLQHTLAAITCPAHNVFIWSQILQLFVRNDHHIQMMCHYLAHCLGPMITYKVLKLGL